MSSTLPCPVEPGVDFTHSGFRPECACPFNFDPGYLCVSQNEKNLSKVRVQPAGWAKQGKARTITSAHSIQTVWWDHLALHCQPAPSCELLHAATHSDSPSYWQGELSQLAALYSNITGHYKVQCLQINTMCKLPLLPASLSPCKHQCLKLSFSFLLKGVRGSKNVLVLLKDMGFLLLVSHPSEVSWQLS